MALEHRRLVAVLLFGLGAAVAVAAQLSLKAAERRAEEAYRDLLGEKHEPISDEWAGIRKLTGRWGCLAAVLEFLRGMGVVLAGAATIYLVAGL